MRPAVRPQTGIDHPVGRVYEYGSGALLSLSPKFVPARAPAWSLLAGSTDLTRSWGPGMVRGQAWTLAWKVLGCNLSRRKLDIMLICAM